MWDQTNLWGYAMPGMWNNIYQGKKKPSHMHSLYRKKTDGWRFFPQGATQI